MATGLNLERLFEAVDQETSGDEGQQQGGLTGKTTPEGDVKTYPSKYVRKYPPEAILTQQVIEVFGNGSPNQYMGRFPDREMNPWMRRFAEGQLRVKADNARIAVERGYTQTKRYMPEIPSALQNTMAETELAYAMDGFNQMDSKYRRVTGLNFEEAKSTKSGAQNYEYEQYID
eukprot:6490253-Amphidinium_carterae.1